MFSFPLFSGLLVIVLVSLSHVIEAEFLRGDIHKSLHPHSRQEPKEIKIEPTSYYGSYGSWYSNSSYYSWYGSGYGYGYNYYGYYYGEAPSESPTSAPAGSTSISHSQSPTQSPTTARRQLNGKSGTLIPSSDYDYDPDLTFIITEERDASHLSDSLIEQADGSKIFECFPPTHSTGFLSVISHAIHRTLVPPMPSPKVHNAFEAPMNQEKPIFHHYLRAEVVSNYCIIPKDDCNPDHRVCTLSDKEYEPVCGCDGQTYDNACVARYIYCNKHWNEGACSD